MSYRLTTIAYFGVRLSPEQADHVYPLLIDALLAHPRFAGKDRDSVLDAVNGMPGFWAEDAHAGVDSIQFDEDAFHGVGIRLGDDDEHDDLDPSTFSHKTLAAAEDAYSEYLAPVLAMCGLREAPTFRTVEQIL